MARVLIIDDEPAVCEFLAELVRRTGHEAICAEGREAGVALALSGDVDVIFLDVYLADGNGLDLLPSFRELPRRPEVIIMTGLGDPDGAELAVRNGAWDYIEKPLSPKSIILPLRRVLEYREQLRAHRPGAAALRREGLVGNGPAFTACLEQLATAARSQAAVLLAGETGTGKELFARCLHENSLRAGRPFVVVDCTNIPENLMESLLFGYERGTFTGAEQRRAGLIASAHTGTLFLDEIGDLPLSLQKKFLRVLQEKTFRRLGGQAEECSDFRLVAATNRPLGTMAEQGRFRADLLYRVQSLSLTLPPLRERMEDLEALAAYLLGRICRRCGLTPKTLSPDVLPTLRGYDWPGNVRQLDNVLESAVADARDAPVLFARHLPDSVRIGSLRSSLRGDASEAPETPGVPATRRDAAAEVKAEPAPEAADDAPLLSYREHRARALRAVDAAYFTRLMRAVDGDVAQACVVSGLGRSRLYDMLKHCGIRSGSRDGGPRR